MKTDLFRRGARILLASLAGGCSAAHTVDAPAAPLAFAADTVPIELEGVARGFPALRNLEGETQAKGEFAQWVEGDRLHVRVRYEYGPTRWIEEQSVIRQEPDLVHERWSWVEMRDGRVERRFEVDFLSGNALAEKREKGELRRWSEHLDLEPGRAFAGGAWPLVIRRYRDRILHGETVELQAVGFTPKPTAAVVAITHDGLDQVPMADRAPTGDRYRIHPKIPWIAKMFVDAPDSLIWLADEPPAAFLRWEGQLVETDDPLVRVDLLPGGTSGRAIPWTPRSPATGASTPASSGK